MQGIFTQLHDQKQTDMRRAEAELTAGWQKAEEIIGIQARPATGNHSGRSHWRALHTKKPRTIRQQVRREHGSLYWASRIESWWVEAAWWDGCGWQSEKGRGGMNGKVLQEVSKMEELWKNIKCHPASRVQKQRIFSLKTFALVSSCLSLCRCQWRPLKTRNATKIYIWCGHLRQSFSLQVSTCCPMLPCCYCSRLLAGCNHDFKTAYCHLLYRSMQHGVCIIFN